MVNSEQVRFDCNPPDGLPKPSVFWMKNDVIILESEPLEKYRSESIDIKWHKSKRKSHKKFIGANGSDVSGRQGKVLAKIRVKKSIGKNNSSKVDDKQENDDDNEEEDFVDEEYVGKLDYEDDEEQEEKEEEHFEDVLKHSKLPDDDGGGGDGPLLPHSFGEELIPIHNYVMTNSHSLVIKLATVADQANYTCGVHNPAGVRFSRPAQLSVFGKLSASFC